jgi:hypothetical protein
MFAGVAFALWSLQKADQRPLIAGVAAALALASKYSAGTIVIVALLAAIWSPSRAASFRASLRNGIQFAAAFSVITLVLQPLLWKHPVESISVVWNSRVGFVQTQIETTRAVAPGQVLDTPEKRLTNLMGQLFFFDLAFYEAGNYASHTIAQEARYISITGHNLFRGIIWGSLFFALVLFGGVLSSVQYKKYSLADQRLVILLFAATTVQLVALLVVIPLPTQRYFLPLLPYLSVWAALAFGKRYT